MFLRVFKNLMQFYLLETNRQITYYVTSRRRLATFVAVTTTFWVYVGILIYAECNAYALY